MWPGVTVNVLLFTTGCISLHIVPAKTDGYLDLSSVWNINLDRWLGIDFYRQADYSEHTFRVRDRAGFTSIRYKSTTSFVQQVPGQIVNELFTSLCCNGMGIWYGNIVLCMHEAGIGEVMNVSWNKTS